MSERRTSPLITAKQVVPPVRAGAVHRARLHAPLLDGGGTRLSVVLAPAGWGKTTLLSQWAHDPAETRGVVWVSLDEADDEPVRFWTYVLATLRREIGGLTDAPLDGLLTPGLVPVDLALPTLLNELSALDTRHVLVLDDYHVLSHADIHEGMEFLLGYLPEALRVVIAGRWDPPLPLARLRARDQLTELRAADLRFTVEESAALLSAVSDSAVDERTAGVLRERTEGWAAGLQLAALRVRDAAGAGEVRADSVGMDAARADAGGAGTAPDRHVLDYLSAEVIDRLPAGQRDLLVRTAPLERLSGPLCDEVLGRTGSAAVLDRFDRADLFVTPVDAQREWYRCHALFRDALRHVLDTEHPGEAARVLTRAADWFLAREYVAEAVELRIRAGDEEGAGRLLRSTVPHFLERGALAVHLHLGARLAPATVRDDPRLAVSLAWAAGLSGRLTAMGPWLDAAEPRIDEHSPPLEGWCTLRGAAAAVRAFELGLVQADLDAALVLAGTAVELESDPGCIGYVVARSVLGAMLVFADRCAEAIPVSEDAWASARAQGLPPLLGLQAASIRSTALFETGQVVPLRRLFAEVDPVIAASSPRWGGAVSGLARLRTVEGTLAHSDGDRTTARTLLQGAVELARTFSLAPTLVIALTALAEVELDDGDRAAAHAALREARETVDDEAVLPLVARALRTAERRAGGTATAAPAPAARLPAVLVEDLTDRERAVLRALTGTATLREIGASLYLSINTVKGYTKVLYRKLGVGTRQDAVRQARALGLL